MNIERIGVIGAGQMGNGIAHVCALAGYDVLINDVKRERIDAAFEIISGNLSRQVARGKISDAEKDKAMKKIHAAPSLDDFERVDLAIERVELHRSRQRGANCTRLEVAHLLVTKRPPSTRR